MSIILASEPSSSQELLSPVLTANAHLIDALPYYDPEYAHPGMQAQVQSMIRDEMATMDKSRDYLAHRPRPSLRILGYGPQPEGAEPLEMGRGGGVQQEMQRVAAGEPLAVLDQERFRLAPPTGTAATPDGWRKAIDNAKAQFEHGQNQLMNLQLMQEHGPSAWIQHVRDLETELEVVKESVEAQERVNHELNMKRKAHHEAVGRKIQRREAKVAADHQYNMRVELAKARDALGTPT